MYANLLSVTVHYSSPSDEYLDSDLDYVLRDCIPKFLSLPHPDLLCSVFATVQAHTNASQKNPKKTDK